MKAFNQYKGLPRSIYILFFGRIVTNMGALVWPMMTLILSNKLGMTAGEIATLLLVMSLVELPCTLFAGKLADKFNKRNLIIVCDLVTVTAYLICGFIKIDMTYIVLIFIASVFASMERPAYDALVADLTNTIDRDRAFSLSYLGGNLGLVLAPTLGGFLFASHLNLAFIISALATLSSTVLIFFFIKNVDKVKSEGVGEKYEEDANGESLFKVLKKRKILLLFIACSCFSHFVYSEFNFLIPINMERLYQAQGAVYFGAMTSVNAVVVIVFTPLLTQWFKNFKDTSRMIAGEALIVMGLSMFIFSQGVIFMYFVAMVIFTFGEIFSTLGSQPYLTKRIPSTHRGRISSLRLVLLTVFQAISQKGIGFLADTIEMKLVWTVVAVVGAIAITMFFVLKYFDKKRYPLLYEPMINRLEKEETT